MRYLFVGMFSLYCKILKAKFSAFTIVIALFNRNYRIKQEACHNPFLEVVEQRTFQCNTHC